MEIITQRKLIAGQPGTKKWLDKYGENLICVRYKYDKKNKKKIITVELIAEEKDYEKDENRIPMNKTVEIRVNYGEVEIGRMVRSFGGKWNPKKKLWELPYKYVKELGLIQRIVSK